MDQKLTVITDNNPLTYAVTSTRSLVLHMSSIKYQPGKNNSYALSRLPGNDTLDDIYRDIVKVFSRGTQIYSSTSIKSVAHIEY